jgi:hypothetical protein
MSGRTTSSTTTPVFRILVSAFLLFCSVSCEHYEKFFEVDGGPEYMYYFAKIQVGSSDMEQSVIIDTGSDTMAFPCDYCEGNDCGSHQDPRFSSSRSKSFQFDMNCPNRILFHSQHVCQFVKSYAEGSSLLGFLASDYMRFKDSKRINDIRLKRLNSLLKHDLKMKAEFGCTTKETGLFKTQYADGILGLDDGSSFIESIEEQNKGSEPKVFSFGLCFHNTGGIMSVDMRKKNQPDDKIVMLNKQIADYPEPIVVPYTTVQNYFEVLADHFEVDNIRINLPRINVMIDSGTTFTHFPTPYIKAILKALNTFCSANKDKCGRIPNAVFNEESCLQYKQPDETYKTAKDLLDSFPEIKIYFANAKRPYILYPKNYLYKEFEENKNSKEMRFCMALKGEEEGRIILGAFSMIDNYYYFDRKSRHLKIFHEDCYLRAATILKKERVLEEHGLPVPQDQVNWGNVAALVGATVGALAVMTGVWKLRLKITRKTKN